MGRLQEVINKIEDEDLKQIIEGVFKVEISYRSAERTNFPRQRLKDVVEGVARLVESQERKSNNDEISKN